MIVPTARMDELKALSAQTRIAILDTITGAGMGHIGGDFSVTDILVTLYFGFLRVRPEEPDWPDRDRFILSKGHCSVALYCVLARAGFIAAELLAGFTAPGSTLNGHPNRRHVPGVEANTGPLGHGLPIALGCALAAAITGASWRSVAVLGDGELQEGSNWEAAMFAGHHGLEGLTAIVDRNRLQQGARTEATNKLEPLADKWRAFGWAVHEIDGHDHAALLGALAAPTAGRPRCIIAHTIKGRGVSFIEDQVAWHHKVPSEEQVALARAELSAR